MRERWRREPIIGAPVRNIDEGEEFLEMLSALNLCPPFTHSYNFRSRGETSGNLAMVSRVPENPA